MTHTVMYAKGDTVVHPRHGIATVSGISTRGAGRTRREFLELAITSMSLKVLVPVDAVGEVGIRELATKDEAAEILRVLAGPCDVSETWSERAASTAARMGSTELAQASMVIRDLTRHELRSGKPLSASEKAMLKACVDTVSEELSLVLEISQDEARAMILERAQAGD